MNEQKLLSIVVPTKDRAEYLISFIRIVASFANNEIELVIQDNSKTNDELVTFLEKESYDFIVYNYDNTEMPVIKNSELAIMNSKGKYVCFMGDDDLLSYRIYEFTKLMDEFSCDSVVFQKARYSWPGVNFKAHKFPNLIVPFFNYTIIKSDSNKEYLDLLNRGAVSLDYMPQLYHGIILREKLECVYRIAGTYFPGPSPDIAVAVAVAPYINKHIICDLPIISSGKSPKSAAGLGAKHSHRGDLRGLSFLPPDIESKWNMCIPFIWTGPTIYAQSTLESITMMQRKEDINKFNYAYFYAHFYVFERKYKELLKKAMKNSREKKMLLYNFYKIKIFINRIRTYVKNYNLLHFGCGGYLISDISNSFDAQVEIDKLMENACLKDMFNKAMSAAED